jgi:hypothetical protein
VGHAKSFPVQLAKHLFFGKWRILWSDSVVHFARGGLDFVSGSGRDPYFQEKRSCLTFPNFLSTLSFFFSAFYSAASQMS